MVVTHRHHHHRQKKDFSARVRGSTQRVASTEAVLRLLCACRNIHIKCVQRENERRGPSGRSSRCTEINRFVGCIRRYAVLHRRCAVLVVARAHLQNRLATTDGCRARRALISSDAEKTRRGRSLYNIIINKFDKCLASRSADFSSWPQDGVGK